MCGIVGYTGNRPVIELLVKGLQRLEYRGYDSAGVAFFEQGKIRIHKAEGKLVNVEKILKDEVKDHSISNCGIGHTRWATHGKPTTDNAHPHRTGHIALVHNGIIENYLELRDEVLKNGHKPASETDSELLGFLIYDEMEAGASLVEAARNSFKQIEGSCSVVVISEKEPGKIVGIRNGSPLVAALDPNGGAVLASDAQPLLEYTQEVFFVDHGQVAIGEDDSFSFIDLKTGEPIELSPTRLDWSPEKMEKGGYPHFMLKEIHEQPVALVDTLNALLNRQHSKPFALAPQPGVELLAEAKEIFMIACGTSWHAALLGKYWIEKWARIPVRVELASEFRYRDPVINPGTVFMGISQSGETADTLAVLNQLKKQGHPTLSLTNVRGSTMSRETDAAFFTAAGPEIGVAATKTFLTQLVSLYTFAGYLGLKHKGEIQSEHSVEEIYDNLLKLPHILTEFLQEQGEMVQKAKEVAKEVYEAPEFFFMGRGYSFPIALEGALKLKEIAYTHAEGYAGGELKHGPIAMIDDKMVVVVIVPKDIWRDKTVSNLEEVKARGARIVGIGDASDQKLEQLCDSFIPLPLKAQELDESLSSFVTSPVVQVLSYEIASLRGTEIDKPRNLAKSVTVE